MNILHFRQKDLNTQLFKNRLQTENSVISNLVFLTVCINLCGSTDKVIVLGIETKIENSQPLNELSCFLFPWMIENLIRTAFFM